MSVQVSSAHLAPAGNGLTPAQRDDLRVIAGMMIPESAEYKVPGADDATFQSLAAKAKANCPVSKLFNTNITLEASLVA